MADRFDVSARLAEGRPAVEHTQTYVDACHQLGYQQLDLTAHTSQVWDWYDAEAGLDLRILDDDTGTLRAALNAIEEALWVQRTQVTELAAAWRGSGGDTAMRFLQRHCDVAAEVAAHVGAAAEHYAALRDAVWKSVDGKVANAVAIDERRTAERSSWLAACHSVTAGTGDRSTAEEVIRQQVKPYVDNDIRNDWLAAMGSGSASVAASYDEAIHALASTSEVRFDVPGDFGPSWQPAFEERPEATPTMPLPAEPAPTVPTDTSRAAWVFDGRDRRCGIDADRLGAAGRCERVVQRCRQSRRSWRYCGRYWWCRRKHRRQYRQHSRLIGRRARRWLRVWRFADR
jgi:hypothetical protein